LSTETGPTRRFAFSVRRCGGPMMAALVCVALGYVIVASLGFTAEARRAPLVVAIPAAVAALVLLVKELRSPTEPANGGNGASAMAAMSWVLLLTAMFLLLGLLVTVAAFVVIFMRVYGREPWRTTLVTTVTVFGLVYVFFIEVLGVRAFDGWLRMWLGF
jgi:hypothetical protein